MEDPVDPATHQEHDVSVLQCQCAGRGNGEPMFVGHHTLPHRRTQQRDFHVRTLKRLRTKLRLSFDSGQKSMPIKRRLNCAAYLSVLPDMKSVIRISD